MTYDSPEYSDVFGHGEDLPDIDDKQPPAPKRTKRGGALIIALVLILGLGCIGGGVALWKVTHPAITAPTGTPRDVVTKYLSALARGDAETALSLSANQPRDTRFTTSEFLGAIMATNPLFDVEVLDSESNESPATVHARYTLGTEKVEASFTVQDHKGTWLLDGGYLALTVSDLVEKVPLSLNGIDISHMTQIELFPGVYTLEPTDPMIALKNPTITIAYPESHPTFTMGFTLSEEGITKVAEAAQTQLEACLKREELNPDGCGFGFSGVSEGEVDRFSIEWTLADKVPDFSKMTYHVDTSTLTSANTEFDIEVNFKAISFDRLHFYEASTNIRGLIADFANPNYIKITLI